MAEAIALDHSRQSEAAIRRNRGFFAHHGSPTGNLHWHLTGDFFWENNAYLKERLESQLTLRSEQNSCSTNICSHALMPLRFAAFAEVHGCLDRKSRCTDHVFHCFLSILGWPFVTHCFLSILKESINVIDLSPLTATYTR